jgi:hypothetical protein
MILVLSLDTAWMVERKTSYSNNHFDDGIVDSASWPHAPFISLARADGNLTKDYVLNSLGRSWPQRNNLSKRLSKMQKERNLLK